MKKQKSVGLAYLLLFLFGFFGVHKFYIGKYGQGIVWLLTGGLFFVGLFIDLFTLGTAVKIYNLEHKEN